MSKSVKSARDNCANQLNPIHYAYHRSRGAGPDEAQRMARPSECALPNQVNQLNPNNAAVSASRGKSPEQSTSSNPSSAKAE